MKIAVGFITYNTDTARYLPYFLDSLFQALNNWSLEDRLVLAVDNSDEPDNYNRQYIEEVINAELPLVDFWWSGANLGFAKSYNRMIAQAQAWGAEFFLMINPDTVINAEAINLLVKALAKETNLGSVAPKVRRWDFENLKLTNYLDTCGLGLAPGLRFRDIGQGVLDGGQFDGASIIGPSGAAALFRMSALEKTKEATGYLDERMFMYKEDCDLAYRLLKGGFSARLVPEALVYHDRTVTGTAHGVLTKIKERRKRSRQVRAWSFTNQHLLYFKHWSQQSLKEKLIITADALKMAIYALFFEQFLFKYYIKIIKIARTKTSH